MTVGSAHPSKISSVRAPRASPSLGWRLLNRDPATLSQRVTVITSLLAGLRPPSSRGSAGGVFIERLRDLLDLGRSSGGCIRDCMSWVEVRSHASAFQRAVVGSSALPRAMTSVKSPAEGPQAAVAPAPQAGYLAHQPNYQRRRPTLVEHRSRQVSAARTRVVMSAPVASTRPCLGRKACVGDMAVAVDEARPTRLVPVSRGYLVPFSQIIRGGSFPSSGELRL